MAKKKTNKKKQNSRANRKIETAKRLETEKKAQVKVSVSSSQKPKKQTPKKPSEIKRVTAKVTEESSAMPKKQPAKKALAKKPETEKKPAPKKKEEPPKPLGPAPEVASMNPFMPRKLAAIAAILVTFSILYNVCVVAAGNTKVTLPTEPTVAAVTTTKAAVTTTEETTYPVTQAPEVTYNRSAGSDAPVEAPKDITLSVPFVNQCPSYPTGCEAASACMLLGFWGYHVSLDAMIAAIPRQNIYLKNGKAYGPSIYEKFVGDPRCKYTSSTPGYGAFSPVITRAVWQFTGAEHQVKNITGSSLETLFSYLDQGCPIIVWATYGMRQPQTSNVWYIEGSYEDEPFQYPRGTHVFVLCGYNSSVVRLMDPYGAGLVAYSQSAFSSKYNLLGRQAIVIVPAETTTAPTTTAAPEKPSNTTTVKTTEDDVDEDTTGESEPSTDETESKIAESSTTTTTEDNKTT